MESQIKQNVMRRVRTIHRVRPFTSGTALAFALLGVSLYAIGRFVFVAQVFRNMPAIEDVGAVVRFFVGAFAHTDLVVQVLTLLTVTAAVRMVRDIGRVFMQARAA
jgi:hypothetical protein